MIPDTFYIQPYREILVYVIFHSCSYYIGTSGSYTIPHRHHTHRRPSIPSIIRITHIATRIAIIVVVDTQLSIHIGFPMLVEAIAQQGINSNVTIAVVSSESVVEITID